MRLINPNEIEFTMVPIMARSYARASVHYELVAFQQDVRQIQKIEAEPVRHAHWIQGEGIFCRHIVKCSHCGNFLDMGGVNAGRGNANFCPNCGAKMDDREGESKS